MACGPPQFGHGALLFFFCLRTHSDWKRLSVGRGPSEKPPTCKVVLQSPHSCLLSDNDEKLSQTLFWSVIENRENMGTVAGRGLQLKCRDTVEPKPSWRCYLRTGRSRVTCDQRWGSQCRDTVEPKPSWRCYLRTGRSRVTCDQRWRSQCQAQVQ